MFSRLFGSVLGVFLSWWGVGLLAALDATIVFNLPFGVDAAVVIVSARHRAIFWLVPLIADAGSLVGAASMYWLGEWLGDQGIERLVGRQRMKRARQRIERHGAGTLAAFGLAPPPFPFTVIGMAAGALHVNRRRFFLTLGGVRLLRFGVETWLGVHYGPHIVRLLTSEVVQAVGGVAIVAAAGFAAFSGYQLYRRHRARG